MWLSLLRLVIVLTTGTLLRVPQGVIQGVSCLSIPLLPQISGTLFGGRPRICLACQLMGCVDRASFWEASAVGARDPSSTRHVGLLLSEQQGYSGL